MRLTNAIVLLASMIIGFISSFGYVLVMMWGDRTDAQIGFILGLVTLLLMLVSLIMFIAKKKPAYIVVYDLWLIYALVFAFKYDFIFYLILIELVCMITIGYGAYKLINYNNGIKESGNGNKQNESSEEQIGG